MEQPTELPADTDNNDLPAVFYTKIADALAEILGSANSPEMRKAQLMLMRRLALSGDVIPSRIPPPLNITEIGGYLNLFETLQMPEFQRQVLASIFGVAGPSPPFGWFPSGTTLFFATRSNDRPPGSMAPAIPIQYFMRSDFVSIFDTAINVIHGTGCQLPILSPPRYLPHTNSTYQQEIEVDMLYYLGRTFDVVPSAALIDPDTDPVAVARVAPAVDLQIVARLLDPSAPGASSITPKEWTAWKCDSTSCQETTATRSYLELNSILNSAGWYQSSPSAPQSLLNAGKWWRWRNITGLVAGVTRYREEIDRLYTQEEVISSALRDRLDWVWNGSEFEAQ